MNRKLLTVAAFAGTALLWASGASALPVNVDASITGPTGLAPFTNICTGVVATGICAGTNTIGMFTITGTAQGSPTNQPNGTLDSQTITVNATGASTVWIFVNETGQTAPLGTNPWLSSFTANSFPSTWTMTEKTCLENGTAATGTCVALHTSKVFTGAFPQTDGPFIDPFTSTSPFSEGEEFIITTTGAGTANLTIHLTPAIPEPASLTLLGSALVGLGWLGRRRRRTAV